MNQATRSKKYLQDTDMLPMRPVYITEAVTPSIPEGGAQIEIEIQPQIHTGMQNGTTIFDIGEDLEEDFNQIQHEEQTGQGRQDQFNP